MGECVNINVCVHYDCVCMTACVCGHTCACLIAQVRERGPEIM